MEYWVVAAVVVVFLLWWFGNTTKNLADNVGYAVEWARSKSNNLFSREGLSANQVFGKTEQVIGDITGDYFKW
jgi:hypothetical protein